MTKKKKTKSVLEQTRKDAMSLLGIGVTVGVGAAALETIPGSAAAQAGAGIQSFSRIALPVGGAILGGRAAIGLAGSLTDTKKKKKGGIF